MYWWRVQSALHLYWLRHLSRHLFWFLCLRHMYVQWRWRLLLLHPAGLPILLRRHDVRSRYWPWLHGLLLVCERHLHGCAQLFLLHARY
jgi:hypothetical protein